MINRFFKSIKLKLRGNLSNILFLLIICFNLLLDVNSKVENISNFQTNQTEKTNSVLWNQTQNKKISTFTDNETLQSKNPTLTNETEKMIDPISNGIIYDNSTACETEPLRRNTQQQDKISFDVNKYSDCQLTKFKPNLIPEVLLVNSSCFSQLQPSIAPLSDYEQAILVKSAL